VTFQAFPKGEFGFEVLLAPDTPAPEVRDEIGGELRIELGTFKAELETAEVG
jgi:hypothetical protein